VIGLVKVLQTYTFHLVQQLILNILSLLAVVVVVTLLLFLVLLAVVVLVVIAQALLGKLLVAVLPQKQLFIRHHLLR
jgi:hypothetical protein